MTLYSVSWVPCSNRLVAGGANMQNKGVIQVRKQLIEIEYREKEIEHRVKEKEYRVKEIEERVKERETERETHTVKKRG